MRLALLSISFFLSLNFLYGQCETNDPERCDYLYCPLSKLPDENAFNDVIQFFMEEGDYKNALYYLEQKILYHTRYAYWGKEKHPDDEYKLKLKLEAKLSESKPCSCEIPVKPQWVSSEGPLGADATAFLKDSKGNYWLGTGSSGGVYFSSDKGKSWEMRNEGIGPWHIYDITESNDTFYIQVDQSIGNQGGMELEAKFFYWTDQNQKWTFISCFSDKMNPVDPFYASSLKKFKQKNLLPAGLEFNYTWEHGAQYSYSSYSYYLERGVVPFAYVNWKEHSYGDDLLSRYTHDKMRIFGFKESNEDIAKLNTSFPRDMFYVGKGNYYDMGKGDGILLSRSGPYQMKKSKKITPLGYKGLVATDVRQLVNTSNGKTYALVNESDIWMYDGSWHHIFNAYDQHLKMENPISDKGYDTKELSLQKDNSLLFSFCGELWQLTDGGKASKVELNLDGIIEADDPTISHKLIVLNATRNSKGELFVVVKDVHLPNDNYFISEKENPNFNFIVLKKSSNKVKIIREESSYGYVFVFTDPNDKVWMANSNGIEIISDKSENSRLNCDQITLSQIAFRKNGNIVVYDGGLQEWDSKTQKWTEISDYIRGLESVSSIGFDKDENLYFGTGQVYQPSCGYINFQGESRGLFRFEKNGKIKPILNCPNTWIYSLCPNEKYGLAVGTSGSGVQFLKTK